MDFFYYGLVTIGYERKLGLRHDDYFDRKI